MEGYIACVIVTEEMVLGDDTLVYVLPVRRDPDVRFEQQIRALIGTSENRVDDLVLCDDVEHTYRLFQAEFAGFESWLPPVAGAYAAYRVKDYGRLRMFLRVASI